MTKYINKILDKVFTVFVNCLFEGFFWAGFAWIYLVLFTPTNRSDFIQGICVGITCIIILLFTNFSIRRFDKKYLKKILANPMSPGLIPISTFFSLSDCLKIRIFRFVIYFAKSREGLKLYDLRKMIIPEYSYSEVRTIDLILMYTGFGMFFLTGLMALIWG